MPKFDYLVLQANEEVYISLIGWLCDRVQDGHLTHRMFRAALADNLLKLTEVRLDLIHHGFRTRRSVWF